MRSQLDCLSFSVNCADEIPAGFIEENEINLIKQTSQPRDNKQSLSIRKQE